MSVWLFTLAPGNSCQSDAYEVCQLMRRWWACSKKDNAQIHRAPCANYRPSSEDWCECYESTCCISPAGTCFPIWCALRSYSIHVCINWPLTTAAEKKPLDSMLKYWNVSSLVAAEKHSLSLSFWNPKRFAKRGLNQRCIWETGTDQPVGPATPSVTPSLSRGSSMSNERWDQQLFLFSSQPTFGTTTLNNKICRIKYRSCMSYFLVLLSHWNL